MKLEAQKLYEAFSDEELYQLLREPKFKASPGNSGISHTKDAVGHRENGGM